MRILMVCLGNICRSPLAEAILQQRARAAGLDWEVDSAGTNGYHIGEAPHSLSQKVARMHGLDISRQRARKFVADDFQRFDRIYAMAEDVLDEMRRIAGRKFDGGKAVLLMHEVDPDKDVDVPDPWSGPEPGYQEAYRMMDEACEKIVENYALHGTPAGQPGRQAASGKPQAAGEEEQADAKEANRITKGGGHD